MVYEVTTCRPLEKLTFQMKSRKFYILSIFICENCLKIKFTLDCVGSVCQSEDEVFLAVDWFADLHEEGCIVDFLLLFVLKQVFDEYGLLLRRAVVIFVIAVAVSFPSFPEIQKILLL